MKINDKIMIRIMQYYSIFFILVLVLALCSIFIPFISNLIWNKYFVCSFLLFSGIIRLIELTTNYNDVLTNEIQEAKENREYKKWLKEEELLNQPKRRYLPFGWVG